MLYETKKNISFFEQLSCYNKICKYLSQYFKFKQTRPFIKKVNIFWSADYKQKKVNIVNKVNINI